MYPLRAPLEIRNLATPAPATGHRLTKLCHSGCFTYPDDDLTDRFNFFHRSSVVQRPFQVAFELRIDLSQEYQ